MHLVPLHTVGGQDGHQLVDIAGAGNANRQHAGAGVERGVRVDLGLFEAADPDLTRATQQGVVSPDVEVRFRLGCTIGDGPGSPAARLTGRLVDA